MQYRFRKPELVPTLFVLFTVALMFSLSVWQLQRLEWKNALIENIQQAQADAPKPLLSYSIDALRENEWHNVTMTGKLLNDQELYATPRYLNGQMGYAVLTPLEISTSAGTLYVLVNRGWVAPDNKDPKARAKGNPTGEVTVEGAIRIAMKQGMFRPDNRPDKNLWFWYDIPAMAKAVNLPLMPILIDETRITQNGKVLEAGPTPFPIEINIRNDHLGYALTWFMIGIAAIVMYGIYYTEKK